MPLCRVAHPSNPLSHNARTPRLGPNPGNPNQFLSDATGTRSPAPEAEVIDLKPESFDVAPPGGSRRLLRGVRRARVASHPLPDV